MVIGMNGGLLTFLVASYATLHPGLTVRPSVRRSLVSHLLPKYSCDLKKWPLRTCDN